MTVNGHGGAAAAEAGALGSDPSIGGDVPDEETKLQKTEEAISQVLGIASTPTSLNANLENVTGIEQAGCPEEATKLSEREKAELHALLSLSTPRTKQDYRRLARLSTRLTQQERAYGKPWQDEDTAELEALLAQYTSLREESMKTINNRVQVMLLGVAAIGAVVGGALTIEKPMESTLVVHAVFSVAIPLTSVFVLLVWLSEAVRSHRLGYFLAADTEARINAKLGRLSMTWEAALWAGNLPRDELFGPSMMALMPLGLIAGAAPFFGLVLTGTPVDLDALRSLPIVLPYGLFAVTIGYVLLNWSRLRNKDVILSTLVDPEGTASNR